MEPPPRIFKLQCAIIKISKKVLLKEILENLKMVPGEDLAPACITIESHRAAQDRKRLGKVTFLEGKKNRLTSVFEETSNCV